jgi:hypothetical protein
MRGVFENMYHDYLNTKCFDMTISAINFISQRYEKFEKCTVALNMA